MNCSMASIPSILPLLNIAPKLTPRLFVCSCRRATSSARPLVPHKSFSFKRPRPPPHFFQNSATSPSSKADEFVEESSSLSALSKLIDKYNRRRHKSYSPEFNKGQTNDRFFPEISHKAVAYWLLGSAASVFGIVVFGGLTRLTESGYARSAVHVVLMANL